MSANTLLDEVSAQMVCKNDAHLARLLRVAPPVVSKLRHGRLTMGPAMILRVHELEPVLFPVAFIRQQLEA